jgi:hypothetical protein
MNNRGFFKVLGLTAAALLVAAFALQATAAEAETRTPQAIQWVWSATSPATNKATSALAAGHVARGLRLSRAAITAASTAADRLIAVHNLCLAHLAQGDLAGADAHCRAALLASDSTHVIQRRGALVTIALESADDDMPALKLVTVIRANVSEAYGVAAADSFTSSVETAAW